jgi:hypothetical protein
MRAAALSAADARRLERLKRLPLALTGTPRRRRVAAVCLGSIAAFTVALGVAVHRPQGLASGLFLGCAVVCARFITEPQFVRFEALGLWPPPSCEPESRP